MLSVVIVCVVGKGCVTGFMLVRSGVMMMVEVELSDNIIIVIVVVVVVIDIVVVVGVPLLWLMVMVMMMMKVGEVMLDVLHDLRVQRHVSVVGLGGVVVEIVSVRTGVLMMAHVGDWRSGRCHVSGAGLLTTAVQVKM